MAKTARTPVTPDRTRARDLLNAHWQRVLKDDSISATAEISLVINSPVLSIRYCLPTQLLGKLTDPLLDALCLQAGEKTAGLWDPRGFASAVIAPWVAENQNVLGRSADPYVSKPLRRARLDTGTEYLLSPDQWTALAAILQSVQSCDDPAHTEIVFVQTMAAIRDRMHAHDFVYAVPPRVSLAQSEALVAAFLAEQSGGERGLAVATALFETFREHFAIYSSIRRGAINTTDASSGAAADLECLGPDGDVRLAVEVKERRIDRNDVANILSKARAANVREVLLCTDGILAAEQAAAIDIMAKAWASGTSLYLATIAEMIHSALPLLGQAGILTFIVQIGRQLDAFSTQPRHRQAWKSLLDRV